MNGRILPAPDQFDDSVVSEVAGINGLTVFKFCIMKVWGDLHEQTPLFECSCGASFGLMFGPSLLAQYATKPVTRGRGR